MIMLIMLPITEAIADDFYHWNHVFHNTKPISNILDFQYAFKMNDHTVKFLGDYRMHSSLLHIGVMYREIFMKFSND